MKEWIETAKGIVYECRFPEYVFKVDVSQTGAVYLQASYLEADTITRKSGDTVHAPLVPVARDDAQRDCLDGFQVCADQHGASHARMVPL